MQLAHLQTDVTAESSLATRLLEYIQARHPRSLAGVREAQAVDPSRFDAYANMFLDWAVRGFGEGAIESMADSFVRFSNDVNFAQARYEATGRYEHKSYRECQESVYSQKETMDDYLMGIYLTNFLWAHHMEISLFFEQRFLTGLASGSHIVEIAAGHGGWGLWALHFVPSARLDGFDISPSSVDIASKLATAAGLQNRVSYALQDALQMDTLTIGPVDACICSFLIEHLEQPHELLNVIGRLLRPGGTAFLTGALTAAQVDHIFEFRHESELVLLAEQHGLRVTDLRSVAPRRTLRGAKFLPRSIALVLQKRRYETW